MAATLRCFAARLGRQTSEFLSRGHEAQQFTLRHGSGGRKMVIKPSKFSWNRFKNDLHFYTFVGIFPWACLIAYTNLIIGQSELAEIPEGYEPEEYEYYKHPIRRWMKKYIYPTQQQQYEMMACKWHSEYQWSRERCYFRLVRDLMKRDEDYRAWYFVPVVNPAVIERVTENQRQQFYEKGTTDYK